MKKSLFFKIVMLLTVVVLTVNCKDYDDDINSLEAKIEALKADVTQNFTKKIDSKIKALEDKVNKVPSKDDVVSLAVYNAFKKDVLAKIDGAETKKELESIQTEINSLEGRTAALEAILGLKDGKFGAVKELQDKIAANESAIKALIDGGINKEAFEKLMKEMGINISAFSSNLSSLVYYPEAYVNGVEAIVLTPVVFDKESTEPAEVCKPASELPECFKNIGKPITFKEKDGKTTTLQMLSAATTVHYNMNSSSIDESKIDKENITVTSHIAKMYTKAGGVEDNVEGNPFLAKFVNIENGKLGVQLDIDYTAFAAAYKNISPADFMQGKVETGKESAEGTENIVLALQVPQVAEEGKDASMITSDYTVVTVKPIFGIDIAKKGGADADKDGNRYSDMIEPKAENVNTPRDDKDWAEVINTKEMLDGVNKYNGESTVGTADERIVKLLEGETLDLHKVVKAISGSKKFPESVKDFIDVDIEKYGFKWVFDLLDGSGKTISYKRNKSNTDQQSFVSLDDKGIVSTRVYEDPAMGAAVDRTPIVRVRIIDPNYPDCPVSQAFIKILITDKAETPDVAETIIVEPTGKYTVECNKDDNYTHTLDTKYVNTKIYNKYGMSKQEFHKKYPNFENVDEANTIGEVTLIKDIEDGQTTYRPTWKVSACDMYTVVQKCVNGELTGVSTQGGTFYGKGRFFNDKGQEIFIRFAVEATQPEYMNLERADMYAKYWHENFTYVEHHSQKPRSVKDEDVANFTYTTDLNAAFVNTLITPTKFKDMDYEYIFAPAKEQIKGAVYSDGKPITIKISDDKKKLMGTCSDGEFVIATISDHTTTNVDAETTEDPLTYEKNVLANYLLNKYENGKNYYMWARLQIKAKCTCTEAPDSYVRVNGKDGFNVRFLRPIDVNSTSSESYIDGVDQGKKGSIIDILKAVGLSDWRKDTFKENSNYYKFYGIKSITYKGGAKWDANGSIASIPATVELEWLDRAKVEEITGGDLNFDGKTDAKDKNAELFQNGGLRYDSNETVVTEDYYLYIPITIEYDRGIIVTKDIKVKVEATTTRAK